MSCVSGVAYIDVVLDLDAPARIQVDVLKRGTDLVVGGLFEVLHLLDHHLAFQAALPIHVHLVELVDEGHHLLLGAALAAQDAQLRIFALQLDGLHRGARRTDDVPCVHVTPARWACCRGTTTLGEGRDEV